MTLLWVAPASDADEVDLTLPPNPPEHGPILPPTVVSVGRDGSLSVWSAEGWDWARYRMQAANAASLDRVVSAARASPAGVKWVCIFGDRHLRYRSFVAVLQQLRSSGYKRICLMQDQTP
jgi:biopolymer transport protein ExbD